MLRIIADENIASAVDAFQAYGIVTTLSGRKISRELLLDADVLLVRSVTRVNGDLLAGTPVKFVGSATAGTDHMDIEEARALGIHVAHAPGSNAPSVCDYVVASILKLAAGEERPLTQLSCAVVGCGAIGGRLAPRLEALGVRVMRCDPPLDDQLRRRGLPSPFLETDAAVSRADIITVHVPLHNDEPYSTYGLIDEESLQTMKPDAWTINTSRGGVVDESALIQRLDRNANARAVVDVWEGEPNLSCDLVQSAYIATAHIAGYAAEGKLRATQMLRKALAEFLGVEERSDVTPLERVLLQPSGIGANTGEQWLDQLVRSAYDVRSDHEALTPICGLPISERSAFFDSLRRNYQLRHELSCFEIRRTAVPGGLEEAVAVGLGIHLV